MKTTSCLCLGLALVLLAPEAGARGRYTKGRTVYQRKCAPCIAVGWKWAPTALESYRKLNLKGKARAWTPAQVCTWMRKSRKARRKHACFPSRMTYREKLNALYYVSRRARGAIRKPRLFRRSFRVYRGPRFRKRAVLKRTAALKKLRQMQALKRARSRHRASTRKGRYVKAPSRKKRPATRRKRR